MSERKKATPIPVTRTLKKIGDDIRKARLRRRISTTIMAERASITRTTLGRIEKGHSGVSLGAFVTVLFVLGMHDRLSDLVDTSNDIVGLDLEDERLPKRIRYGKKNQ